jgi:glycosyltransferase involved in cell wall biosynthesis
MNLPMVSCIVPVFNGERFVGEALNSILDQTHRPLEVIVVDDGSTDGTAQAVRAFGDPVFYIHQVNAGPAEARNRGVECGRGDFYAFLDADDLWHPEKLRRQLSRFRERPELAYSVTLAQNIWEDTVRVERERMKDHRRSGPVPAYVSGSLVTSREWMKRTNGFNPELEHGDAADWFQRADAAGAVGELLDEVLLFRRIHGENRSRLKANTSRQEFLEIIKARLDRKRQGGG